MSGRDASSPLLCVPGLGLNGSAWRPTLRALRGRNGHAENVVAPLPGYGVRPADGEDLRPSALGTRLVEKWLADAVAPTVLMGHSASCQIVARAAELAPDRVRALVLVGPTTDYRATSWPRLVRSWVRTALWERPGQVPLLARTYSRTGLLRMLRAMDAARREDVRASLRKVDCPVLVVRGRHDRICAEDWADELAAVAPAGSTAVTLDKGAHMVPLTHGGMLAAAVANAVG